MLEPEADKVADEIIAALGDGPSKGASDCQWGNDSLKQLVLLVSRHASRGCVMTLQGLSGTGKGTTVDKLKEKLPNAQTWSDLVWR